MGPGETLLDAAGRPTFGARASANRAIRKWVPTMWIFFIGKNLEIHPKLKRNKSFDALRSTVEMGMLMYNTYSHLIPINISTQTILP